MCYTHGLWDGLQRRPLPCGATVTVHLDGNSQGQMQFLVLTFGRSPASLPRALVFVTTEAVQSPALVRIWYSHIRANIHIRNWRREEKKQQTRHRDKRKKQALYMSSKRDAKAVCDVFGLVIQLPQACDATLFHIERVSQRGDFIGRWRAEQKLRGKQCAQSQCDAAWGAVHKVRHAWQPLFAERS